jgi:hypothetical protein
MHPGVLLHAGGSNPALDDCYARRLVHFPVDRRPFATPIRMTSSPSGPTHCGSMSSAVTSSDSTNGFSRTTSEVGGCGQPSGFTCAEASCGNRTMATSKKSGSSSPSSLLTDPHASPKARRLYRGQPRSLYLPPTEPSKRMAQLMVVRHRFCVPGIAAFRLEEEGRTLDLLGGDLVHRRSSRTAVRSASCRPRARFAGYRSTHRRR